MKILFVTSNKHKFLEIKLVLEDYKHKYDLPIKFIMAPELQKIEIQSNNLERIAKTAAEFLAEKINCPFFIEDSGLFINSLKGFPGPYTHYVYKTIGIRGILRLMQGITNRVAEFRSTIALHINSEVYTFNGSTLGTITTEPHGTEGFGFDPIFIPKGEKRTFAEMSLKEKNKFSHRAKATRKMLEFLLKILHQ